MKRHGLTLSFLLISTSLVQAQSDPESAFQALKDNLNASGLFEVETGSMHYQESEDLLTVQNVTYKIDWTFPMGAASDVNETGDAAKAAEAGDADDADEAAEDVTIRASITIPNLVTKGFSQTDSGFAYETMTFENTSFDLSVDAPGTDNDLSIHGDARGTDVATDGFYPSMEAFSFDAKRPIASVMDFARPLLLETRYGSYKSEGYNTEQSTTEGTVIEQSEIGPFSVNDLANGNIASYNVEYQESTVNLGFQPGSDQQPSSEASDDTEDSAQESASSPSPDMTPPMSELTYRINGVAYENYNIGVLWSAIDPNAPQLTGKQTVLSSARADGITLKIDGLMDIKVGPTVQSDVTISSSDATFIPALDRLIGSDTEAMSTEENEAMIKSGLNLLRSMTLGLSEATDIEGTITMIDGPMAGQKTDIAIDSMRLADLSSDGIAEVSVSGINVASPVNTFELSRFAIEDLEFPEFAQIEKVLKMEIMGTKATAADRAKLMPNAMDISLSGLAYSDQGQNAVSADAIRIGLDRQNLVVPAEIRSGIENLSISRSLLAHPLLQAVMAELKMDTLTVNEDVAMVWNEESNTIVLNPLNVELADIASLSGSIGFGGIVRDYLENPEGAQAAVATASVLPAELTLSDLGGLDTLINVAGGMMGMGPDQIRAFAPVQVQGMLSSFTTPEFADLVADQVTTFLKDPQTLRIALSPVAPVPVAQILGVAATSPQSIPEILSIGVEANR